MTDADPDVPTLIKRLELVIPIVDENSESLLEEVRELQREIIRFKKNRDVLRQQRIKAHKTLTTLIASIRVGGEHVPVDYDIHALADLRLQIGCIWCGDGPILFDYYCGREVCNLISGRDKR